MIRKSFVAVLLLLIVGAASLSAVQIVSDTRSSLKSYDYVGLNIGYGVTDEKYDLSDGQRREDKGYQFGFSFNDFTFFNSGANVGFYIELGISLNTKTESTVDGVPTSDKKISPVFSDFIFGFGFRADLGKRTGLLIGVGPEMMMYSKKYNVGYYEYEKDFLVLGVGLDLEGTYMVSRDVYIGVGFRSSFMFFGTEIDKRKYETTYTDYDNYFGYRVLPRFSVFLGI